MEIKLVIPGVPLAKQSMRFTKSGIKFQPEEIKQNERNLRFDIRSQLPAGFKPFDCAIAVKKLWYVFPPVSSLRKAEKLTIENGGYINKRTKPDLSDNLNKQLFDAMQGIVYLNDSQICQMDGLRKYYGNRPRIELVIETVEN